MASIRDILESPREGNEGSPDLEISCTRYAASRNAVAPQRIEKTPIYQGAKYTPMGAIRTLFGVCFAPPKRPRIPAKIGVRRGASCTNSLRNGQRLDHFSTC